MLDEKLKVLWSFEGDKLDYILDEDINNLYGDYSMFSNHLMGPLSDAELLKKQVELANNISYGLFVLSTLFIAAGRLEEVVKKIDEKNNIKNI